MDKKIFPDEPEIPILPNLFTAGNLVCGFFAILTIFEGINQADSDAVAAFSYYQNATFLIFAACLFDLFDGRIARMRGQDGPFGREFDSLADIVSFGIAPALLVAKAVLFQLSPPEVGWGIGILYLLCAALRLARFNCMAAAPRKEGQSSDFVGLPVPMAAGAVVSTMYLVMYLAGRAPDGAMDLGVFKYVIALAMAGVSILMMSRVVYPSFKHINMRTRGDDVRDCVHRAGGHLHFQIPVGDARSHFFHLSALRAGAALGGPPLAEQAGSPRWRIGRLLENCSCLFFEQTMLRRIDAGRRCFRGPVPGMSLGPAFLRAGTQPSLSGPSAIFLRGACAGTAGG